MSDKPTRDQLAALDLENLLLDERFKRFLFTTFQLAGIFNGYFHSEDAVLAYGEGRRSLGLDMLSTLASASSRTNEEVLMDILAAEIKTQKEVSSGRRNQYQRERSRELDGDDGSSDDRGDRGRIDGKLSPRY